MWKKKKKVSKFVNTCHNSRRGMKGDVIYNKQDVFVNLNSVSFLRLDEHSGFILDVAL